MPNHSERFLRCHDSIPPKVLTEHADDIFVPGDRTQTYCGLRDPRDNRCARWNDYLTRVGIERLTGRISRYFRVTAQAKTTVSPQPVVLSYVLPYRLPSLVRVALASFRGTLAEPAIVSPFSPGQLFLKATSPPPGVCYRRHIRTCWPTARTSRAVNPRPARYSDSWSS